MHYCRNLSECLSSNWALSCKLSAIPDVAFAPSLTTERSLVESGPQNDTAATSTSHTTASDYGDGN